MVDWKRVEQLHEKGLSWEDIASDPKVGFHPDRSVTQAGPALRRLYYRRHSRAERQGTVEATPHPKRIDAAKDRRWSLARIGYLVVPLVGIWFVAAYLVPSPVGLIVSAVPYILIGLLVAGFVLALGLFRTAHRWTPVFRTTVVLGIVLGLVLTGIITLSAVLIGCPFLPSASSLTNVGGPGWTVTPSYVASWQQNGVPVVYSYSTTWCPFCSASSWAIWKALTEFQAGFDGTVQGIPGYANSYSSPTDVYPSTPAVILSSLKTNSPASAFVATEGTGSAGVAATSDCVQQAYVSAYSGNAIPFLVVNGRYVHGGSSLVDACLLSNFQGSGANSVASSVLRESGVPWNGTTNTCYQSTVTLSGINVQAAWVTAFMVRSAGYTSVSAFLTAYPALNNPSHYQWTSGMKHQVDNDLAQIP